LSARADLELRSTLSRGKVEGDPDNDWHLQASTSLTAWTNIAGAGPVIAGRTRSLARNVGATAGPQQFYRALQTEGLYDPSLFRTVSLTLTQANWGALLTAARITGSNVYCFLVTLDNGADRSYARTAANADVWFVQTPSPGTVNQ